MVKRKQMRVQVLVWPDSVDERIVAYVERNNIDPSRIEIVDESHIVIRNEGEEDGYHD